ncbi:MAG: hypothetical protein KAY32_05050 [Candidatus Eisenbacteria sp.]|nr:hypothetical protein [Candidatus Eisenbacteria bacterium]
MDGICAARSAAARRGAIGRGLGILLVFLVLTGLARPVQAQDALLTIMKNTLLGGATGLILAGTLTLVVEEDSRSDVVRWGVVIGTFAGFALGATLAWRGEEDLFPGSYGDDDIGGRIPLRLRPTHESLLAWRAARELQEQALTAPEPAPTGRSWVRLGLFRFVG